MTKVLLFMPYTLKEFSDKISELAELLNDIDLDITQTTDKKMLENFYSGYLSEEDGEQSKAIVIVDYTLDKDNALQQILINKMDTVKNLTVISMMSNKEEDKYKFSHWCKCRYGLTYINSEFVTPKDGDIKDVYVIIPHKFRVNKSEFLDNEVRRLYGHDVSINITPNYEIIQYPLHITKSIGIVLFKDMLDSNKALYNFIKSFVAKRNSRIIVAMSSQQGGFEEWKRLMKCIDFENLTEPTIDEINDRQDATMESVNNLVDYFNKKDKSKFDNIFHDDVKIDIIKKLKYLIDLRIELFIEDAVLEERIIKKFKKIMTKIETIICNFNNDNFYDNILDIMKLNEKISYITSDYEPESYMEEMLPSTLISIITTIYDNIHDDDVVDKCTKLLDEFNDINNKYHNEDNCDEEELEDMISKMEDTLYLFEKTIEEPYEDEWCENDSDDEEFDEDNETINDEPKTLYVSDYYDQREIAKILHELTYTNIKICNSYTKHKKNKLSYKALNKHLKRINKDFLSNKRTFENFISEIDYINDNLDDMEGFYSDIDKLIKVILLSVKRLINRTDFDATYTKFIKCLNEGVKLYRSLCDGGYISDCLECTNDEINKLTGQDFDEFGI